jgi:integrase/recombinase XerD
MTIHFERRTDQPDAAGRCAIHLRAYFDGQRLRYATRQRCLTNEWNAKKGRFSSEFIGYKAANASLQVLSEQLLARYRALRAQVGWDTVITPTALKQVGKSSPSSFITLYTDYLAALEARGNLRSSLVSAATTLTHIRSFVQWEKRSTLSLADYDISCHDRFLAYLRQQRHQAPNSVCKSVKHVRAFLRYLRDEQHLPLAIDLRAMPVRWEHVEKVYLTAEEIIQVEQVVLPLALASVRDAFLFCCYTGLRQSDLRGLTSANLFSWKTGWVLRLTQTKTRTPVSIYLRPQAVKILEKYEGQPCLLPVTASQVMNRKLKQVVALAGVQRLVETVRIREGQVVKTTSPLSTLVTMHTARHTFAVLSLQRSLPLAVLQQVLGHAKIQTTMLYARVVADFQHLEMRRVWG